MKTPLRHDFCSYYFCLKKMVLIVQRGLNGQNNEGRPLFDKRYIRIKKKMWLNTLKEFPNYNAASHEYFC